MNTPPGQVHSPRTPITPKHGANFLSDESPGRRRSSRLIKKKTNTVSSSTYTHTSSSTLSPPPSSPLAPTPSPRRSPRHVKRATFLLPEDQKIREEEDDTEDDKRSPRRTRRQAAATITDTFGLPTPAKTPRKRKLSSQAIASSAKVLFPSTPARASAAPRSPAKLQEPPKTPVRKAPKTPRKQHAVTIERSSKSIEIFTDSRERIPKLDLDSDNPFLSRPSDETRSSKRRRQQMADRISDKKLGIDAGRSDGMYYTFRGKKVFRRFHSLPDAGSRAGSDDEGDLEEGLNPASIKPRLLFPSADPPSHHSEAEQDAAVAGSAGVDDDEEAETDIDETASLAAASQSSIVISSKVITTKRKAVSRMTPEDDDDGEIVVKHQQPLFPATPRKKATPGKGRGKRVSAAAALFDDDEDGSFIDNLVRLSDDEAPPTLITKKAAPSPRGTKRRVEFGLDTPPQTVKKKTRRTFALN